MTQRRGINPGAERYLAAGACVNLAFRKAARLLSQRYDEALAPAGVKVTQFSLLVSIRLYGPIQMTDLARGLAMDRTTLTRNLRPLERDGLVEVVYGKDRRRRRYALTLRGHEVLDAAFPLWERAQAEIVHGVGEERWEGLRREIRALAQAPRAA